MTYKNTKTGAVIDSPCIIAGGDWVQEVEQKPTARTTKSSSKKE